MKYDILIVKHFLYVENVMQIQEKTCFIIAIKTKNWNIAMNEEVNSVDDGGICALTTMPSD